MTTTSDRLEQLAAEHDKVAEALRLAARELFEDRSQTATKTIGRRLNVAMKVRAAARNGDGNGKNHFINKTERQAIIRDFMGDGATHTISDVMAHLEEHHQLKPGRNIVWLDVKRGIGAKPDPHVKYGYRLPTSSNGHGPQADRDHNGNQTEGRRKVLLALLKRGPQMIKTLTQALNDAGYKIQRDRTRQFITQYIPEAHCEGVAQHARWVLGPINGTAKLSTKKPKSEKQTAKRKKPGYSSKVRTQRERSANLLAQFDTTTPSHPPDAMKPGAVGVYVRRGYLKRKDNGWVRTAKPFSLDMP